MISFPQNSQSLRETFDVISWKKCRLQVVFLWILNVYLWITQKSMKCMYKVESSYTIRIYKNKIGLVKDICKITNLRGTSYFYIFIVGRNVVF